MSVPQRSAEAGRSSSAPQTLADKPIPRWSWLVVLAVGLGLFLLVLRALVATQNPNILPTLLLLGAAVVPITFVTFLRSRRLEYSVPGGVIAGVALIGGVVGVVTAGVLEYDTLRQLGPWPSSGWG